MTRMRSFSTEHGNAGRQLGVEGQWGFGWRLFFPLHCPPHQNIHRHRGKNLSGLKAAQGKSFFRQWGETTARNEG